VRDYLIDTQIIRYWFDGESGMFPAVKEAAESRTAESRLWVSGITLGEIAYGHCVHPQGGGVIRSRFLEFITDELPLIAPVTQHTAEHYGKIRAHLVENFGPKKGWGDKKRAEQLCDPFTALSLGIDENDLWLVSQAAEMNLTFVTKDGMARIRDAVAAVYPDLLIENWCETGN
jgi:predicted nucleic acid-binding protein